MRKGQLHPAATVSKNLLADGLFFLMEKKSFAEITIIELCERAQVSRRTFYRHFNQIDEVIAYKSQDIIDEFVAAMNIQRSNSYEAIIESYFIFWRSYSPLLALLNQNNLTYAIFTPYLLSLRELPWLFPLHRADGLDQEIFNCELAYHSGGLWSLLTYWIMSGCVQSEHMLAKTVASRR
ncbi:MAG: TetR/AcrR family transcriptional regulator [Oscillospiraceae bacterium]